MIPSLSSSSKYKKVEEDIDAFRFNTAVSAMMECINEMFKLKTDLPILENSTVWKDALGMFTIIISPFAPHMAEEIWQELGNKETIFNATWPSYDPNLIEDDLITVAVQVNGKVRGEVVVSKDATEEEVKSEALKIDGVKRYVEGENIKKAIYVKGRLLSLVI